MNTTPMYVLTYTPNYCTQPHYLYFIDEISIIVDVL